MMALDVEASRMSDSVIGAGGRWMILIVTLVVPSEGGAREDLDRALDVGLEDERRAPCDLALLDLLEKIVQGDRLGLLRLVLLTRRRCRSAATARAVSMASEDLEEVAGLGHFGEAEDLDRASRGRRT